MREMKHRRSEAALPFTKMKLAGEHPRPHARYRRAYILLVLAAMIVLTGCNQMYVQPRYDPYEPSTFFADGTSARPLVPNTVARGRLQADTHLYEGVVDGAVAMSYPFPVTAEVLARGQERYNIYCAVCHGYSGYGDGMIVQRGFTPPPSFHTDRARELPEGYMFQVITNGIGAMYSYGTRVPPEDRWAIITYIRALQLSQQAAVESIPPDLLPEGGLPEDAPEGAAE